MRNENKNAVFYGWVYGVRKHKKTVFIDLIDGSSVLSKESIQVVTTKNQYENTSVV